MWLSIIEATKLLNVSRRTIYNWIDKDRIKNKRNLAETKILVWVPADYMSEPSDILTNRLNNE